MSDPVSDAPLELSLQPAGRGWKDLVRSAPQDNVTRATRLALGLVTHRPVVMGGHQPGFWHAGILAKWCAVEALASEIGGAAGWVVADQSPGAGTSLEYPARADAGLTRGIVRLGDSAAPPGAQPTALFDPPQDATLPAVSEALATMAALLSAHAREPTLARQLHAACLDAIAHWCPSAGPATPRPVSFFASELHETRAFGELVGAMRADPDACAALYNEASRDQPGAGVRELARRPGEIELPLWERTSAAQRPGPWPRVTSDRLGDLPDERLVLRALPMTGLLRRWACDLFVHGTGGGGERGYDRVTERWFAAWLNADDLAPAVVATATLRLDFREFVGELDVPTPEQIARAQELAHRAEHDPALAGDEELGRRKRALVQEIALLPRGDARRAELFRQMQDLRGSSGSRSAGELKRLQSRAEALAARSEEASIAADRGWPFVFHHPATLARLRDAVVAEIRPPAGRSLT